MLRAVGVGLNSEKSDKCRAVVRVWLACQLAADREVLELYTLWC